MAIQRWRAMGWLVFLLGGSLQLLMSTGASAAERVGESTEPKNAIEKKALEATVRIRVQDDRGESFGTGTIIDRHDNEVLVLTCGHIFRESAEHGKILCDLFTAEGPQGVPAKIISYDLRRDVGLISLRPGVPVEPANVGGGGHQAREGSFVFTVGCSKGADPTLMRNRVVAINRYHGPANLVVGGCPVDGRSGGGLFSEAGVLIGVCNAADQPNNEGLYAALGPVHTVLDEAGLGFIYRREIPLVASSKTDSHPRTESPTEASRELQPIKTMQQETVPPPSSAAPNLAIDPEPMNQVQKDQGLRNSPAELICILKGGSPQEPDKVFVIEQPSSELLGSLSSELAKRGPHRQTTLEHIAAPPSQGPRTRRLPELK
jgi:Trypsin-like peptidase domain